MKDEKPYQEPPRITFREDRFSFGKVIRLCPPPHRRRKHTEKQAKVVAAVWGTVFIQFLAVIAVLHEDDLKNIMNLSFSSNYPGAIHPFLQIILVQ